MRSKSFIIPSLGLGIVMTLMLLSGCGGGGGDDPSSGGTAVEILIVPGATSLGADAYVPNPLTVQLGDTVIWRNNDDSSHTVTSDPPNNELSSGSISANGGTFSHTFMTTGTFDYHCAIINHNMQGTVVVQ